MNTHTFVIIFCVKKCSCYFSGSLESTSLWPLLADIFMQQVLRCFKKVLIASEQAIIYAAVTKNRLKIAQDMFLFHNTMIGQWPADVLRLIERNF